MTRSYHEPWAERTFPIPTHSSWTFDVVGMGLNAVDRILTVHHYPRLGGKQEIIGEEILPGGQVATAMIACHRLGLPRVRYIGKVGDDEFGRISGDSIARSGVDFRYLRVEKNTVNQAATIIVDAESGERTIFWRRPETLNFREGELTEEAVCCAPVIHLDGHDQDAAVWCAQRAREHGMLTVLDIDNVRSRSRELLGLIDFCIMSERFPRVLSGEENLFKAMKVTRRYCPGLLASTLGPAGVALLGEEQLHVVPGYPVSALDTTGAGDVFHGAFIYALLQRWTLGQILNFANAAAALSCTGPGARGKLVRADEVLAFIGKAG